MIAPFFMVTAYALFGCAFLMLSWAMAFRDHACATWGYRFLGSSVILFLSGIIGNVTGALP